MSIDSFWPDLVRNMPSEPITSPACLRTALAALASACAGRVEEATSEDRNCWNTGSVSPLAFETGGSSPPSASWLRAVRSMARLIALRTGSWLVGNLVRFGSRLLVWTGGEHTLWLLLPDTNTCCTPEMKLPPQSS